MKDEGIDGENTESNNDQILVPHMIENFSCYTWIYAAGEEFKPGRTNKITWRKHNVNKKLQSGHLNGSVRL